MQGVVQETIGNIKPWLQRVAATSRPSDSKYFTTTKRGEVFELKAELNSERKDRKKEAIKKVIASMTVGKDVSSLFPDVINCMQTDNLELKKLVYLYLMNYAKTQPDTAIMAVNTFVKDCEDPNPLIRALAVRTMGCIRVEKITAYHCEPLRKCLKDEDPYVRKTAAICVAKLYDIDPVLVEEHGFLCMLRDLLNDSNPMVVANAVAAITEILEHTESQEAIKVLSFNQGLINKLLTALNECSEWGQVFILDAVADYIPIDDREAQSIVERVLPRLAHANAAVVLSSVKVTMKMLELIGSNQELIQTVIKKLAPPLVTLLSAEPEIQYVALRNINLIIQKRKDILNNEMKVFFVKYNDPIYVKLEKLDIMIRLTNQSNITQVLAELKEYAKEVDVDFVRKSVRAIGRCAIKVNEAAERCVSTLLDLIQTKVNYVVQEAIVVIKDIFRKYPNRYESIIATLCDNLDTLDESEARASMIWIIGEYADRIDNADELLESFLDGFEDENTQVQLQLLTAIVKLFLKRPQETRDLVQSVLGLATQKSDNPDLRDRGFIYWRLLSTDPDAAKHVVLAEKPLISEETDLLEPTLLDELICNLASLASVYHRPPTSFLEGCALNRRQLPSRPYGEGELLQEEGTGPNQQPMVIPGQDSLIGDLLDIDMGPSNNLSYNAYPGFSSLPQSITPNADLLGDPLDGLISGESKIMDQIPGTSGGNFSNTDVLVDLFGGMSTTGTANAMFKLSPQIWLDRTKGKGLEIEGSIYKNAEQAIIMELIFTNHALAPMSGFAIQFNKNSFGLIPSGPLNVPSPLMPKQTVTVNLPLANNGPIAKMEPLMNLQIAVKNDVDVFYFATLIPINVCFSADGEMSKIVFLATWKDISSENEKSYNIISGMLSPEVCAERLKHNNVFTINQQTVNGHTMLYQAVKLINNIWILAEMKMIPGNLECALSLKSRAMDVYPAIKQAYETILNAPR